MSDEARIPFNRVSVVGSELRHVENAVAAGHLEGDRAYARRCQRLLEEILGVPRVLLTPSCTQALEMAALLLDLRPGDEVVVPSFSYVTTAGAFALRGARPVFADVRDDTLNVDATTLASHIGPRTRALVVVHYAGVACDMEPIRALAREAGVPLVEDNAHGLLGRYRGRPLGSFGTFAAQSFHETKNLTCGEGGALVVNEPSLEARAEQVREKGTDRARFVRGEADRYEWRTLGSSFLPSELQAAFLFGQLEGRERIQARRRTLYERYREALADWGRAHDVHLPAVPADCDPSYHLFHLLLPTPGARDALIPWLRERGIVAPFHYLPLHLSPMGRALGGRPGDCPVAEWASPRLVRLPLYPTLDDDLQDEVIDALRDFPGL